MNKHLKIGLVITAALICIYVLYTYLIFMPNYEKKQQERFEQEQKEALKRFEANQASDLDVCLAEAKYNAKLVWNKYCQDKGEKELCSLSVGASEGINQGLKELEDFCFKRYPVK